LNDSLIALEFAFDSSCFAKGKAMIKNNAIIPAILNFIEKIL
jgi:hypothetical protein